MRPVCQAMLTHEYTYAYAAVDVCTGELDSLILPHVNTGCMQLFLNEVSARHPDDCIVMVITRPHLLAFDAALFVFFLHDLRIVPAAFHHGCSAPDGSR